MRVVAIIQARLGSTRLPRKVLADIEGLPMLTRVIERAEQIRGADRVVVAWPASDAEDLRIYKPWLIRYVGDSNDVLARYDYAASQCNADVVMRLTADCPLLDPAICEEILCMFLAGGSPSVIAGTREPDGDGFDCEVFSAQMLRLAHLEATDAADREHVTPMIWQRCIHHTKMFYDHAPKLSVDTLDDLERVRAIYRFVGKNVFSRAETLAACAALEIR